MTEQGTRTTDFRAALLTARTAYVAIPHSLLAQYRESEIVSRVRAHFAHLRAVGSFETEFDSTTHWRHNLAAYLAEVDCLVIACDSSRLIGAGVLREIKTALRLNKPLIIFKVDEQAERFYFGYTKQGPPEQPVIRLRTCAEMREAKARRAQEAKAC
jgi:hypothetical protein